MARATSEDSGARHEAIEIEWQFDALDLRPVERWLATLPTLSIVGEEQLTLTALARPPRRMVDSYLDTEDWRMARAGFVLRIRRRGRHDEVTLKDTQPAHEGGLRQRLEVTEDLPDGGVAALGPDGPVGRRMHSVAGRRPVRQVLQVRTRRRPFVLRVGGVDAAELALDDTMVVVGLGQRPMHLRRVEVEVLPEWQDALEPIVRQLQTACGLQPATLSKFEAGLLALGAVIPGPPDLGPTDVGADVSLGDLAYAVLRRQLEVLRATEPGTRLGEDPEELHDMRVATRRLRAALDLFAEVLPVRARTFRAELGWMAAELGSVRDLDVQLEALDAMTGAVEAWGDVVRTDDHDPLSDLSSVLHRARHGARADMLAALDSVRWDRLVNGMATMVRQGPLRRSVAARLPATVAVPELVGARHSAVMKAARRAKRSGRAADFHRVRIRCKRLRYTLEFTADLYGGRTNRYTRRLTGLQDRLGLMQDAEVAAARLAELAVGEAHLPAPTVFVMGTVAERHRRDLQRLLRRLPDDLSRVSGREWQDLASAMDRRRGQALALVPPIRRTLRAVPSPPPAPPAPAVSAAAAPDITPVPAPPVMGTNPSAGGADNPA
jgi:CHAD domain-containing protein